MFKDTALHIACQVGQKYGKSVAHTPVCVADIRIVDIKVLQIVLQEDLRI
ncbi:MAG: hypothetical protein ACR5K2_02510 [Wolbachia sp.]